MNQEKEKSSIKNNSNSYMYLFSNKIEFNCNFQEKVND